MISLGSGEGKGGEGAVPGLAQTCATAEPDIYIYIYIYTYIHTYIV